jgi:predicted metal-dependent phosphotriesterase family hydrolase
VLGPVDRFDLGPTLMHEHLRYGGEGYAHILRDVVPVMERFGIDTAMCRQILVDNPARALSGAKA